MKRPVSCSALYVTLLILALLLAGCAANLSTGSGGGIDNGGGSGSGTSTPLPSGSGAQGVQLFIEPDNGVHVITDAIDGARQSVWVEMYLLTNRSVIRSLEDAANRGLDVRVMLETHPYGSGSVSPTQTLDRLSAAGIKVEATSPDFQLTHEKCMIVDGKSAYIMTTNFTNSALGVGSYLNREYGIIDTNPADVQAVSSIFQADWNRTRVQLNDPNLVISPLNSRSDFLALINSAHTTLLIEAEEMQDSAVEQAIASAAQRGVHVQVVLPVPKGSDSNGGGITVIKQAGVQVREDPRLYMHAKIIVADGARAFVGSENISSASLDQNRELGILLADQTVINTLQQTFQQDWGDSQDV